MPIIIHVRPPIHLLPNVRDDLLPGLRGLSRHKTADLMKRVRIPIVDLLLAHPGQVISRAARQHQMVAHVVLRSQDSVLPRVHPASIMIVDPEEETSAAQAPIIKTEIAQDNTRMKEIHASVQVVLARLRAPIIGLKTDQALLNRMNATSKILHADRARLLAIAHHAMPITHAGRADQPYNVIIRPNRTITRLPVASIKLQAASIHLHNVNLKAPDQDIANARLNNGLQRSNSRAITNALIPMKAARLENDANPPMNHRLQSRLMVVF
jgi:hypothetical protein